MVFFGHKLLLLDNHILLLVCLHQDNILPRLRQLQLMVQLMVLFLYHQIMELPGLILILSMQNNYGMAFLFHLVDNINLLSQIMDLQTMI